MSPKARKALRGGPLDEARRAPENRIPKWIDPKSPSKKLTADGGFLQPSGISLFFWLTEKSPDARRRLRLLDMHDAGNLITSPCGAPVEFTVRLRKTYP